MHIWIRPEIFPVSPYINTEYFQKKQENHTSHTKIPSLYTANKIFLTPGSRQCMLQLVQCTPNIILNFATVRVSSDDVMKWKRFPLYQPFVRGFQRSPVRMPLKRTSNTERWCFIWCYPEIFETNSLVVGDSVNTIRRSCVVAVIVRRAGLLWSQEDFEWRWSVPLFKCLTVLEFSFILFDLCLLITFFNFIMNYVPIVTFWIFTYHKIWILSIMFCSIWSYWIIYFLACLEVSWRVVS